MSPTEVHAEAKRRHKANPSKCFQRFIREVHSEVDPREQIASLAGARVESISKAEAESLILRYEWLGNCGRGASAFYGLKIDGELLGAAVFGVGTSHQARNICGANYVPRAVSLMRGCCVHFVPKRAPSFLIKHATRLASIDHGWKIFIAYADSDAGEVGIVYQRAHWRYIGQGSGRPRGAVHLNWRKPDGIEISSQTVHHQNLTKRQMFAMGWEPIPVKSKGRYVWFEGNPTERATLKSLCRYPSLPYPKRNDHPTAQKGID